jgi:hypothetical protein
MSVTDLGRRSGIQLRQKTEPTPKPVCEPISHLVHNGFNMGGDSNIAERERSHLRPIDCGCLLLSSSCGFREGAPLPGLEPAGGLSAALSALLEADSTRCGADMQKHCALDFLHFSPIAHRFAPKFESCYRILTIFLLDNLKFQPDITMFNIYPLGVLEFLQIKRFFAGIASRN